MKAELCGVTVDCRSVEVVAGSWSALLGLPLRESLPGRLRLGPVSGVADPEGHAFCLVQRYAPAA